MSIDSTKQGYIAKHKGKKFKTESAFLSWLNKTASYKISFKDKRQDCLQWIIDEQGEILHSNLQGWIWNGNIVDLDTAKVGKHIGIFGDKNEVCGFTTLTDFEIDKIIKFEKFTICKAN